MKDLQHITYTKEVIEFVAVAKEYCDFIETASQIQPQEFIQRLQKFIPLIYLKGALLPPCETEDNGLNEDFVTEDDYNYLHVQIHQILGQYDEYLEVFDENIQYSEAPIVNSISEKICDIYQDLKNFISAYRSGIPEITADALWLLNNNFENYWGKSCAGVIRAIHPITFQIKEEEN